jgi:hypothetical protein
MNGDQIPEDKQEGRNKDAFIYKIVREPVGHSGMCFDVDKRQEIADEVENEISKVF